MNGFHFEKKDTNLVKGMAILLLLFYHLFESEELLNRLQVDHAPFSQQTFLMLSGFGNICVAVFAFLSAYGITAGLQKKALSDPKEMLKDACRRCGKLMLHFAVMYGSVNLLWFSYFDYRNLYGRGWQGGLCVLLDMFGLAQLADTPTLNMTWWYMELAILIIFAVPFLYLLVKKLGWRVLFLGLLLPSVVSVMPDAKRYLIVVLLGVVCASEGWLEKLLSLKIPLLLKTLLLFAAIFCSILFRQNYLVHSYFLWIVDAPVALLLCWFGKEVPGRIPVLREGLTFLGKHSMNIFFVHTFFYMAIYQKWIYSFRYAGVILLVLTAVTLFYSVILEGIKTLAIKGVHQIFS